MYSTCIHSTPDPHDSLRQANLRSKCFFWALNPPPLQAMSFGAPDMSEYLASL